jgi:hypothetical protein
MVNLVIVLNVLSKANWIWDINHHLYPTHEN